MSDPTGDVAAWRRGRQPDELCPRCDGWCEVDGARCPACDGSGRKDLRALARERGAGLLCLDGQPFALATKWERWEG